MNDKNSRLSVLKSLLRVGQWVEMSLKWLFVSTAGRALRASLGTRFTRSQVTPRSSTFSTNVKYANPSSTQFVIESGCQSLKEKCNSNEYCKTYLDEKVKIEVEETLSRLDCEPHFQRLTGYRPKASPLRLRRHWHAITRRRPSQITKTLACCLWQQNNDAMLKQVF